jgi:hypothetical protein
LMSKEQDMFKNSMDPNVKQIHYPLL